MKTTSQISKSKVMSRAWKIFRGNSKYSFSFSDSLKRAWAVEKEDLNPVKYFYSNGQIITESDYNEIEAIRTSKSSSGYLNSPEFAEGARNYYREKRSYYGD
jgi:hypothetical protein